MLFRRHFIRLSGQNPPKCKHCGYSAIWKLQEFKIVFMNGRKKQVKFGKPQFFCEDAYNDKIGQICQNGVR